ENLLAKEWLPGAPEIHERLLADPPARVADVACGQGRSSIELARGYPKVLVDGIDSEPRSREPASTSPAPASKTVSPSTNATPPTYRPKACRPARERISRVQ